MADVTGGPTITNASPFAVPADMTALKDHFGALGKYSVTTSASLPASGNWGGRQLVALDTMLTHIWNGSAWVVGNTGGWTNLTLATNWSTQANYGTPQFRVIDGWCELRGVARFYQTIPTAITLMASGAPVPASTDTNSVWLISTSNAQTILFLNPRTDGAIRIQSNATGGAGTDYAHLHGLRYPV